MRAVAALLLLAAFWLALAACGGGAEPTPAPTEPQAQPQQSREQPAAPLDQPEAVDQSDQPDQPAQQAAGSQQIQPPDEPAQQVVQVNPPPEIAEFVEALDGRAFEQPIELLAWPGGGLLVAEQRGGISLYLDDGSVRGVLDLSERVIFRGEQGLLSVALDPEFVDHPFLYVWYSPRGTSVARLSRFPVDGTLADAERELIILEIEQPFPNHNGGAVRFGPDGMLYLGIGDGGAANDPYGHGQNAQTLLGAIIRIDVRGASTQYPYRVPADNPLLGVAGVRPEIYAWGMRNPWRMAFDPETGALWYADVGQNRVEEVGIIAPGGNHGWNVFEGRECFGRDDDCAALDHIPPARNLQPRPRLLRHRRRGLPRRGTALARRRLPLRRLLLGPRLGARAARRRVANARTGAARRPDRLFRRRRRRRGLPAHLRRSHPSPQLSGDGRVALEQRPANS